MTMLISDPPVIEDKKGRSEDRPWRGLIIQKSHRHLLQTLQNH